MMVKRALQSWSRHNLYEDLWSEILSRLPVISLLRFRCVSKSWRALIGNPDFARLHLSLNKKNHHETHLLTAKRTSPMKKYEYIVRCSKTFRITRRIGFPILDNSRNWMVLGSIDGVVMLKEDSKRPSQDDSLLWNPSIRKTRFLPPSPPNPSGWRNFDLGLGFDPLKKDYKYVRFVGTDGTYPSNLHSVSVYTFRTNTWKTIQLQGKGCYGWYYSKPGQNPIYLKGILYVMAWNLNSKFRCLVSFDLSTEEIASTNLPMDLELNSQLVHSRALTLADGGSSLALVTFRGATGSLWVSENMETDIESMIWTKRHNFSLREHARLIYRKKNGDMFLKWWKWVTFNNTETHDEKILLKRNLDRYTISIHAYMESLILLK